MATAPSNPLDGISRFIARAISGPFPAIIAVATVIVGTAALLITPREEEPQIVVPVADVIVTAPGLSAEQIERQVTTPLEKLLYQVDGVEYVYSISRPDHAVVTVRFFVGEDREDSLLKIHDRVHSHVDEIPASVASWVVKPVEVDDVPIVVAALWSDAPERIGDFELRRIAEEVELQLQSLPNTGPVEVTGGRERVIRIEFDPDRLAARLTTPHDVAAALRVSNVRMRAGALVRADTHAVVDVGDFVASVDELRRLVVNVVDGLPVYLEDVASVVDGPAEPTSHTWLQFGPASQRLPREVAYSPAVFVSVAKKKGSNAVQVARDVADRLAQLERDLFPPEVHVRVVRDYGRTADRKVWNLVVSLGLAVLTVVVFIGIFLGWRAAIVVALAVPICYAAAITLDLLAGYTINRVTLFALILSLGLLVDDPITGVDNIERHLGMGGTSKLNSVVDAMAEIRGALLMSTVAIVLSFAPMFFITGMMGPYMAPMAFNVPVTVAFSTAVAFLITPWIAHRLLVRPSRAKSPTSEPGATYRLYARCVGPFLSNRTSAWLLLGGVGILFMGAIALPAYRLVPLKLLPHDNKDEFQVVIDAREGTTLERTEAAARAIATWLAGVPEVRDISGFVAVPSPSDFNAMIRQYYLRHGTHLADLRVTLAPRESRVHQSYEIMLRVRSEIERIAASHGVKAKLVEVPPGPPVVSTVTAEVYGGPSTPYGEIQAAALSLAARLEREPHVADVDTTVEHPRSSFVFVTDKEKAALSGVSTADAVEAIAVASGGLRVDSLHVPTEARPLEIVLALPFAHRNSTATLEALHLKGRPGIAKVRGPIGVADAPQPLVQLGEIGRFLERPADTAIHHKNLQRVVYVFADALGRPPAEIVMDVEADRGRPSGGSAGPLEARTYFSNGGNDGWSVADDIRVVWTGEGEWKITLRVFRDLGIAFTAALVGIFLVLLVQTGLATLAGIIMLAIPLTVIGIMPGFWLLNEVGERVIDGLPNPVLFSATAMIGMIALAGIVVRNSLVLIEFVHLELAKGASLDEALLRAGGARLRPIFLTAGTTLLGNIVITLDPIFSGLAWSIIFGIIASTLFTLVVVPVVYFLVYANVPGHGCRRRSEYLR